MNTSTHIKIAKRVLQLLESELNIKLDKRSFIWGNIKPDVSPLIVMALHSKHTAMDFVKSETANLLKMKNNSGNIFSREFSTRLGVIAHYLSDFFCYAHLASYRENMFKHCIYEHRLAKYYKHFADLVFKEASGKYRIFNYNFKMIFRYIDRLHEEFTGMGNYEPFQSDMEFALRVSASFCISFASLYISPEMKGVA